MGINILSGKSDAGGLENIEADFDMEKMEDQSTVVLELRELKQSDHAAGDGFLKLKVVKSWYHLRF